MIHGYLKIDSKRLLDMCELWDKKRIAYNEKHKQEVIAKHLGTRKLFNFFKKLKTPKDVLEWYEYKEGSIFHSAFDVRRRTRYDVEALISICKESCEAGGEVFVSQNLYSIITTDLQDLLK